MARRGEQGFTLLEVLVALAILGVSLAAIYQAFGTGLRNDRQARLYEEAVALAEARMAQVGTELPAAAGRWSGEESDLRWTLLVQPAEDEPLQVQPSLLRLMAVTVEVFWPQRGGEGRIALSSFRLAAQPPGAGSLGPAP